MVSTVCHSDTCTCTYMQCSLDDGSTPSSPLMLLWRQSSMCPFLPCLSAAVRCGFPAHALFMAQLGCYGYQRRDASRCGECVTCRADPLQPLCLQPLCTAAAVACQQVSTHGLDLRCVLFLGSVAVCWQATLACMWPCGLCMYCSFQDCADCLACAYAD